MTREKSKILSKQKTPSMIWDIIQPPFEHKETFQFLISNYDTSYILVHKSKHINCRKKW